MEDTELIFFFVSYFLSLGASLFFALGFNVVAYVFEAKATYEIAKRRGLEKPWLAWIPMVHSWYFGKIADKYCLEKENKTTKYAKWVLITQIAMTAILSIYLDATICGAVIVVVLSNTAAELGVIVALLYYIFIIVFSDVVIAVSVIASIFGYKALHKIYRSCDTEKSLLFLMLSIFTPAGPFLLYSVRNQDTKCDCEAEVVEV